MGSTIADELREIAKCVRQEHRAIEHILEDLRAGTARLRRGAIPKHQVEQLIFELWAKLEDHAAREENLLLQLVPRLGADDVARIKLMVFEHDLQRRLLLSTLNLTEPGVLAGEELVVVSERLVRTLRADIELEEELLDDLGGGDQGQTSTSAR